MLSLSGCKYLVKTETVEVPVRQYVDLPPAQIAPLTIEPAAPTPSRDCGPLPSGKAPPYCGEALVAWVEDVLLPVLRLAQCDRAILRCLDLHREDASARTQCVTDLTRNYCGR